MVGFRVGNKLSESGTVSRGVCGTNEKQLLSSVVERTKIERKEDGEVKYLDENEQWVAIPDTTPVSMNFWGFTPDYFNYSTDFFKAFVITSYSIHYTKLYEQTENSRLPLAQVVSLPVQPKFWMLFLQVLYKLVILPPITM